jgi:hypothetical protein
MKIPHVKWLSLTLLSWLLFACHPEPDSNRLYDELVISTNYDQQADFGSYGTYALPTDTIGLISNTTSDTILTTKGGSGYPRPVIEAINAAMSARGYTRVDRSQNPDIGINVIVATDYNVFQQVVYGNPYSYNGGYGGYYGYNSYYYGYPYVSTYVSNTGVLIIQMVDLKNKTPDNKVKVIWDAYLGDVYGTIHLVDQTVSGINQAFLQSPYIGSRL